MSKHIYSLRNDLRQLKFDNNLLKKIDCSKEDNKVYKDLKKKRKIAKWYI